MESRLSRKVVEGAKPGEYRDTECRGLVLRVWPTKRGLTRAYYLRWPDGRGGTEWTVIGHHSKPWRPEPESGEPRVLTLELARQEAVRLLGGRVEGRDPAAARKGAPGRVTLRGFAPRYLRDWASVEKSPRTVAEERGNLDRHLLPLLGDEHLAAISAAHVSKLKGALRAHPVTANRCRALLSVVLNVAKTWGELPPAYVNPCSAVPPFEEQGRERPLTVDELARVGPAMLEEETRAPIAVAAIRTLMLTGARPVEILGVKRAQLQAAAATGVIVQESRKHAKKRRPVYVNPLALAVMEAAPQAAGNPYLFPGEVEGRPLTHSGVNSAWKRIRRAAKVEDVKLYDLRHTFGTVAAMVAKNARFVQDLLGHSNMRTTEKYMHLGQAALGAAGDDTALVIAAALEGPSKAKKGEGTT